MGYFQAVVDKQLDKEVSERKGCLHLGIIVPLTFA
jgi:hypothetical protein